jgi:hypothetical protein
MNGLSVRYLWTIDRILQYLKSSPRTGLLFKRGQSLTMEANYVDSLSDRRSTSNYCVFHFSYVEQRKPIAWWSKKQSTVARSSVDVCPTINR